MSRRRKLWFLVIGLVLLALAFVHPWPRYGVWGLLTGESFYQGYPTSYWRNEVYSRATATRPPPLDRFSDWLARRLGFRISFNRETPEIYRGDPESLAVLLELLQDDNEQVRCMTCHMLMSLACKAGSDSWAAQSAFTAVLDRYPRGTLRERRAASLVFRYMGPLAKPAVPLLKEDLQSEDPATRLDAALALLHIDPSHEEIWDIILPALTDPTDARMRHNAMMGVCTSLRFHREMGVRVIHTRQEELLRAFDTAERINGSIQGLKQVILEELGKEPDKLQEQGVPGTPMPDSRSPMNQGEP